MHASALGMLHAVHARALTFARFQTHLHLLELLLDLADRMAEALSDPGLWQRLRAGIRPPKTHLESAGEHVTLYREVLDGGLASRPGALKQSA